MTVLRAPFPWFGGKSRVASIVWRRFGDVRNYVEPFFGSGAVLLARPADAKVETVNDLDAYVANFWRAVQADPDRVADFADWPVNEADLHARHRWLVETRAERVEQIMADPEFYDAKVAGWWVWGQCLWIGSGWCKPVGARHANGTRNSAAWRVRPDLSAANGRGETIKAHGKRPALTGNGPGVGVHRATVASKVRTDRNGGRTGVLTRQVPDLSGDSGAAGRGIHATAFDDRTGGVHTYMRELADRLRRVRVVCGDWSRVVGPAVTTCIGTTGVFLDPPYSHNERSLVYSEDHDVATEARAWAIENGGNTELRIALCGYEGEHEMPADWSCVAWKAAGGYGARTEKGKRNAKRERVWFSPHCLDVPDLFSNVEVSA